MSTDSPIHVFKVIEPGASDIPQIGQSDIVLAPPLNLGNGAQTFVMLIGPDAQLGSTSGGDTNDPTYVAGPPVCFTFDANDYITFGDVLDAVFSSANGWTIAAAYKTAADMAGARAILSKHAASQSQFSYRREVDGKLDFFASYGGDESNRDEYRDTVALADSTRYIVVMSFNPALARASRGKHYVNGAVRGIAHTPAGSDGVVGGATSELRVGLRADGGNAPTGSEIGLFYIWDRVLSDGEVAAATDEIDALAGGWL